MTIDDISTISGGLFATGALFILLIFSLLSFGILRMFQQKIRAGWFSFAGAVVSAGAFALILDQWFV
ncbi:hypothetical protein [Paenibacillus nasutitermitis]|uniref:Uncharacterized protein n=1 Tax=Paenibacillus nasutitermitis TaxID=1652958 RepID=A0A916YWP3_9BACL|nr:hypothetical protein GCM10010911_24050 [Paenibacillus nasutitermitis]